ncbi:hypothetical protein CDAR_222681 [Caerostris darwini]|uniref:Uncharacterized protein n=1 Tax=Caerostris darwini TaxID=1538125 RepID=A0AAV4NGE1_9ARAC|nr:hypothetical protein CDAR_222681 [Caerostris darwini]
MYSEIYRIAGSSLYRITALNTANLHFKGLQDCKYVKPFTLTVLLSDAISRYPQVEHLIAIDLSGPRSHSKVVILLGKAIL